MDGPYHPRGSVDSGGQIQSNMYLEIWKELGWKLPLWTVGTLFMGHTVVCIKPAGIPSKWENAECSDNWKHLIKM